MASACIDSILDKLNLLENSNSIKEDNWAMVELVMLKLELRLLRTFFLCARKWSNHVSLSPSSSLEGAFQKNGQHLFFFLSLTLENPSVSGNLAKRVSDVREKIKYYKEEIHEMYINLSDCLLRSLCIPVRDEFMEFMDSLLENLADFLTWDGDYDRVLQEQIECLQEKLKFLKRFIGFALLRLVEQRHLEHLLIHCDVVAVKAAHLSYICWFYRNDSKMIKKIRHKISRLLQKIKPVDARDFKTYIQVLIASRLSESSRSLTTEAGKCIIRDFVDSLLCCLWELLEFGNSFVISVEHQMKMLYAELKFLGNIINKQPEKFNGLHEKSKNLLGAVVNEAGIVIFSLCMHPQGSAREMELSLFDLLSKIKLIKIDVAEKYPVKSTFNFPTTNEVGFIDLIINNLREVISLKVDSISPAMNSFQTVQEDLVFLRSFLENIVEQHNQNEKFQALWIRLVEVCYDVEYFIDSLMVGDISYYSLMSFSSISEEIKLIKTQVLEIDHNEYVLKAQKAANTSVNEPLQTTSSTISEVVVGFDDEAKTIIDQLTRGSMQLDIVSIVGMPGLGKTTLAKKVYHDPLVMYHFHIRAWCYISQAYCKKDLLLAILVCILPKQSIKYSNMNEDDLAEELYKRLKGSRYVVVLDDVWDIEAWNVLEKSFPNDANGSRILLTSRLYEVALLVKPLMKPHLLRRLSDSESWELLQKKLACKESYPPASCVLGMQIAKNCNGLPLTVVIIAGILATQEHVGWDEVARKLSSIVVCKTEQCKNILELSYKHLPDYLKPCLLYFASFPKNQEIPIWKLMQLWIAEGFVQKNEQKSLEEVAEDYIMSLISRSLILAAKEKSTGGAKTCRIHDLIHEFCVAKAKEENFLLLIHGYNELYSFDEPHNLRRLCIYSLPKDFVKSRLFFSRIRSLLFYAQSAGSSEYSYNLSFVRRLKLLRVLDLGQINLGFIFPSEIALLVHLRYLAILGSMKVIPSSIAYLSNLETFLVTAYNGFSLPDAIWNMQKLRHLHVTGVLVDLGLAKNNLENSILYNLDTFSTPKLYLGQSMEELMRKFPNVRKLKCCFLESEESAEASHVIVVMGFLSRLESLELILHSVDVHHIEFHFPLILKKLTLKGFSWSAISRIAKLPNLEVLKLFSGGQDGVNIWEMEDGEFPKLKFLQLEYLDIVRWTGSGEHLPCLQKLVLEECEKLEELPSCLEYISTLESIEVRWCKKSLVSLVREIEQEHIRMGNEDLKIVVQERVEED